MAKNRNSYRSGCEDELRLFRSAKPDKRFHSTREEFQRELESRFDEFQWPETISRDTFPSDRFLEANPNAYVLLFNIQDKQKYIMTVNQCSIAVVNAYNSRK